MKTHPSSVPHFLRVAQALALVSGIGVPAAGLLVSACGSSSGPVGLGVADSGSTRDATGVADSGRSADSAADAPEEVLGILVMPEGGDAESGGGPGFFPDLPV
jgi:hypothetical protein